MTPSVEPSGGRKLIAWRLDQARLTWDSGEGAFQVGGRWNSKGVRGCALGQAQIRRDPKCGVQSQMEDRGNRTSRRLSISS